MGLLSEPDGEADPRQPSGRATSQYDGRMTVYEARKHIGHRVRYQIGAWVQFGHITWAGQGQVLALLDGACHPRSVCPGALKLAPIL